MKKQEAKDLLGFKFDKQLAELIFVTPQWMCSIEELSDIHISVVEGRLAINALKASIKQVDELTEKCDVLTVLVDEILTMIEEAA